MEVTLPLPVGETGHYLRDMVPEDALAYQNIHEALKEAGQYYSFLQSFEKTNPDRSIDSRDVGAGLVAKALSDQVDHRNTYRLALCDAKHDIVGYTVILNGPDERRPQYGFEIGYFIHPRYQGKNLATLSMAALIEEASKNPGLKMFYGLAHPTNEASSTVLKKLGMHFREPCVSKEDAKNPERLLYAGDMESFIKSAAYRLLHGAAAFP